MPLILGSTSSARVQLLKNLGLDFEIRAPSFDERTHPFSGNPHQYTEELSLKKNESILKKSPQELVVTCDTIVYCDKQVLNKPIDYQDAFSMLKLLSGKKHKVISGITLAKDNQILTGSETTDVEFHPLSDTQIEQFLKDPHFIHRSCSYTLSGLGALLIKSIEGSYENVIGIPFNTFETLLQKWNLSLCDL